MDNRSVPEHPTFYCDHDHPEIQKAAMQLLSQNRDPVETARRTLCFVRDSVLFGFDLYRCKASQTLERGYGACWNKALLLVALLRANDISAHFCTVPVRRTFIRPAIGAWFWLANEPFFHCLVRANLDGRQVYLDAVLDSATYETFYRPRNVAWDVAFNGLDDMRLYTESVIGEITVHRDIDAVLDKKAGNNELPAPLARLGNWNVNRKMWKRTGRRPGPVFRDAAAAPA